MKQEIVLAFDYGLTETGVAVGQTVTGDARGVATLSMNAGVPRWRELKGLVTAYAPTLLLVGLPLHMDGEESEMSAHARNFAEQLKARLELPVILQDERLTTRAADAGLEVARQEGVARTDHELAACIIFSDWYSNL